AAKVKHCEVISEWTEAIRNHFWFVCQSCNGDEEKLKDSWLGVLHHIAGEHEWVDGECEHGPLVATEVDKTYLDKNSKAFESLRKVILDQKFLKSLPKYVTFRNEAFVGRTYLAAIDHNSHTFRKAAITDDGKPKYNKVYSKRSRNWRITAVKDPKTYNFWPTLATRI
ncbi:Hypothetical predicted protein, partial [Paramuricea clavata]